MPRTLATVRPATPEDLPATARLHRRQLPRGFFARLGPRFLARYHATFAASPDARLLVAERGGDVAGFLAGTVANHDHYRFVLRRRPVGLIAAGAAALLRDGDLAKEFVRTRAVRYGRAVARQLRRRVVASASEGAAPTAVVPDQVAVLTHVAVSPEAQSSGAGRSLVERFVDEARTSGAGEVRLITAVRSSGPAFYRRLGWHSYGRRRAADGSLVEEFGRRL